MKNKGFLFVTSATVLLLFNMNEMNKILGIFYRELNDGEYVTPFIVRVQYLCNATGLLTFGTAVYSGLSLKFGLSLIVV